MYLFLKALHVSCALLTFFSFSLRGFWMLAESPALQHRAVRIVPHAIDAVLLGSAIALVIELHQYPGVQPWLTAKLLVVAAYIALGAVALRRGRTKAIRVSAWLGALAVFAYIVAVALTHDPLPFLN